MQKKSKKQSNELYDTKQLFKADQVTSETQGRSASLVFFSTDGQFFFGQEIGIKLLLEPTRWNQELE